MRKTKRISFVILGILLLIAFVRIPNVQGVYVGVQNGDKYEWLLNLHNRNWGTYFSDDLETTLGNLVPLGADNLTRVYNDLSPLPTQPQIIYFFNVTAIGSEQTGQLLSPEDNSTITSTPVNGSAAYELPEAPEFNSYFTDSVDIVNDTPSFLRQTMNLSKIYGVYALMEIRFAPTTINWSTLVSDFLGVMSSQGGWYNNISATAQSNGFLIGIPAWGFQNNSVPINITVAYNSRGVLSYYKFSYGGQMLVEFVLGHYSPQVFQIPYDLMIIGLAAILLVEIIVFVYIRRGGR